MIARKLTSGQVVSRGTQIGHGGRTYEDYRVRDADRTAVYLEEMCDPADWNEDDEGIEPCKEISGRDQNHSGGKPT